MEGSRRRAGPPIITLGQRGNGMGGGDRKRGGILAKGEPLRRAIRWLSDEGRHDLAAIEEACRRFDLSPTEEEFLLSEARRIEAGDES